MNRAAFFSAVRSAPFNGPLNQHQVDGITVILDEWEKRGLSDVRWLAYMLATTFHETARTMQPIREFRRGKGMDYGTIYYGRGFVQLTWEANYRKASTVVAVDLVARPDQALDPAIAATIMFDGMLRGWFTGVKLADYINGSYCDYVNARRVINGTDRAAIIAAYAASFEKALKPAAELQPQVSDQPVIPEGPLPVIVPHPPDDPVPVPEIEQPPTPGGFLVPAGIFGTLLLAAALKLFHVI